MQLSFVIIIIVKASYLLNLKIFFLISFIYFFILLFIYFYDYWIYYFFYLKALTNLANSSASDVVSLADPLP